MSDADVIIVGAGMPGATLGLALAASGLTSILIDPLPFEVQCAESFDGRASAISFSAFRQWRAVGAAEYLEPHAQRIEQILVTDGRPAAAARGPRPALPALRFRVRSPQRTGGEPLGHMLENRHIRAGLAQVVTAAGIEVLAGLLVARVEVEPGVGCGHPWTMAGC